MKEAKITCFRFNTTCQKSKENKKHLTHSMYMRKSTLLYPVEMKYGWNHLSSLSFIDCTYATNSFWKSNKFQYYP